MSELGRKGHVIVESDESKGQVIIRYKPIYTVRQDILLLSRDEAFELSESLRTLLSRGPHGGFAYVFPSLKTSLKDILEKIYNVEVSLDVEYSNDCRMVSGVELIASTGEKVFLFDLLRELRGGEEL